jgi:hypothetical protein
MSDERNRTDLQLQDVAEIDRGSALEPHRSDH